MASEVSSGKRTATTEDLKRLILFYEYMAAAMAGDKDLGAGQQTYVDRAKQVQQVVSLRDTDMAKADFVEDVLFAIELGDLKESWEKWADRSGSTASVEYYGDTVTIAHTSVRERKLNRLPKPLVLLGINHITVSDGAGHTANLDDKINEVRNSRGQSDLSPKEQEQSWLKLLELTCGKAVADHMRKVINGEVSLLADGPRGYATVRRQARAKRQLLPAQFLKVVQALTPNSRA